MKNQLTDQPIADSALKALTTLAEQQIALTERIEKGMALLEKLNKELNTLSSLTIPDKMAELGMETFTLTSGHKVSVNPFYQCSIIKEEATKALDWLSTHGHEGVIKREISCPLQKGQKELADKIMKAMDKLGVSPIKSETVHHATLKSLFRELTENGKTVPANLFNTFVGKQTKITTK